MDREDAPCRLCGEPLGREGRLCIDPAPAAAWAFVATANAPATESASLEVRSCTICGLTQRIGAAVPTYKQVRTAALLSPSMRAFRTIQAAEFIKNFNLKESYVVEIGTGRGELLPLLAEQGVVAQGVEAGGPPPGCVAGAIILDAYPSDHSWPPGSWDAAWCLNFLEHAPNPVRFLRGIADALVPGAPMLLEVPDHAQQRRLGRAFDYVADHLSYFEADTLVTALSLSGFTIDRIRSIRDGENLEVWAKRRPLRSHADEAQAIVAARSALAAHLGPVRARGGRTAVWGASHQALLLMTSLNSEVIECVLDSSPDKQGRFTPVSRLPIVEPTPERVAALDAVVIAASGYEREIAAHLRELGYRGVVAWMVGSEVRCDA